MKIAIVGCGALGSFYGGKFWAAGEDVTFLLRSDFEAVRARGVQIRSVQGDFQAWPRCAQRAEEIGQCDLVVIGLKTTANDRFPHLLPPLVGPGTTVLTLQNGLGNEERLAALFGAERILGGLCFVCLNRVAPGLIDHTAHGDVLLGELQRGPESRTFEYARLFRRAGIPCEVTECLDRAHWQKLVWNIPFNGLGVAGVAGPDALLTGRVAVTRPRGPCLATDHLLREPKWAGFVRELMQEVVAVARRLGHELPPTIIEDRIARTLEMGAYKASTLIDYERGLPLELESLFLEPLRRARLAQVETPRLELLCQVLAHLDAGQHLALEKRVAVTTNS